MTPPTGVEEVLLGLEVADRIWALARDAQFNLPRGKVEVVFACSVDFRETLDLEEVELALEQVRSQFKANVSALVATPVEFEGTGFWLANNVEVGESASIDQEEDTELVSESMFDGSEDSLALARSVTLWAVPRGSIPLEASLPGYRLVERLGRRIQDRFATYPMNKFVHIRFDPASIAVDLVRVLAKHPTFGERMTVAPKPTEGKLKFLNLGDDQVKELLNHVKFVCSNRVLRVFKPLSRR
jgi:hypothetical protein